LSAAQAPPASESAAIRVGVAGWDYPDWNGVVYPAAPGARFDRLAWLSRFVDLIEVNSTFYRPAAPATAAAWLRRTAERPGFVFTAKAHRSWSHDAAEDLPAAVATTLSGLRPIHEAGRLGALLLQFPHSFHRSPAALERLERLFEHAVGWPLCVEVRHASWRPDEVAAWLAERGVAWCLVDQPQAARSALEPLPRVTAAFGYARLHGRNVSNWFRADAGRDARYDYLYGADELDALAALIRGMAGHAPQIFAVQNNHFRGQALVNALQLRRLLTGNPPSAPEELVAAYPELEGRVNVQRRRLF